MTRTRGERDHGIECEDQDAEGGLELPRRLCCFLDLVADGGAGHVGVLMIGAIAELGGEEAGGAGVGLVAGEEEHERLLEGPPQPRGDGLQQVEDVMRLVFQGPKVSGEDCAHLMLCPLPAKQALRDVF